MMKILNEVQIVMQSRSVNEGFSRVAVTSFIACLDPNIEELTDIKIAVSEAVTNAIVHGYKEKQGKIYITVTLFENNIVRVKIRDKGEGIPDIERAMEPLFTTGGEERAGLGFALMESLMDKIKVTSKVGAGTTVILHKRIRGKKI